MTMDDFNKLELRIGTIVKAEPNVAARKPAYKLWVDLGELGIKGSSAQITHHYQVEDLVGKQVLCVCSFPPKKIADFTSEILVTGVYDSNGHVFLMRPDGQVANGSRLA